MCPIRLRRKEGGRTPAQIVKVPGVKIRYPLPPKNNVPNVKEEGGKGVGDSGTFPFG